MDSAPVNYINGSDFWDAVLAKGTDELNDLIAFEALSRRSPSKAALAIAKTFTDMLQTRKRRSILIAVDAIMEVEKAKETWTDIIMGAAFARIYVTSVRKKFNKARFFFTN